MTRIKMPEVSTKRPLIASYPRFSKLQIKQKPIFDDFAHKYGYYCDFNFANLFCWDIDEDVQVSLLNGNLVVRRQDYLRGEYLYSILGNKKIDESLAQLLKNTEVLNWVPEIVVKNIKDKNRFVIENDRDSHDYVFNVKDLVELKGNKYKNARNRLNKFKKEFERYDELEVTTTSVVDLDRFKCFQDVFYTWKKGKGLNEKETARERKAIDRLLEHCHKLNMLIIEIKLGNKLVAFSVNNIASPGYAITHFEKAIKIHKYFNAFVVHEVARMQGNFGIQIVNWEDDLGFPGLRQNKSSYRPKEMLNKYQITLKS